MNIFRWVKQECLDWWFLPIGEKIAEVMTIIVIIVFWLALMFVNNGGKL